MLYIDCLLSQGVEMSIFKNPDINDFISKINEIEKKYNFTQDVLDYYEFKKNKVLASYCSSHKNEDGFIYIDNMLKYAVQSKKLYIINCTQDQIMGYGMKYVDEFEPKVLILESLVDSLLEGQKDKEKNLAYVHSGILKLGITTKRELKKEAVEIGKKLINHSNNANLDTNCLLNFKILISLLMFANDNESIDQGELLKMRRDFSSITDLIGTDRQYEVYYSGIGLFGTLVQIFEAMGVTFDPKTPIKYVDLLKDDIDTYIKFFSSLESYVDLSLEDPLNKWITYLDELGAHELNNMRLTWRLQLILLNFLKQDSLNVDIGYQKLQEEIIYLSQHRNKYDYIKQKLISCYQIILPITLNGDDADVYLKYAEDYIELGIENNENRESLCQTISSTISIYLNLGVVDIEI